MRNLSKREVMDERSIHFFPKIEVDPFRVPSATFILRILRLLSVSLSISEIVRGVQINNLSRLNLLPYPFPRHRRARDSE